jgi:uncharacterized phage protein (TIGR01671 family)
MKRKLKFRVWNENLKRWEKGLGLYFDDGSLGDFSECFHNQYDDPAYVVQQFTGILDARGQEIFEGDIVTFLVNHHGGRGEVKYKAKIMWINCGFTALLSEEMIFDNGRRTDRTNIGSDMLVIGNAYENEDLLK